MEDGRQKSMKTLKEIQEVEVGTKVREAGRTRPKETGSKLRISNKPGTLMGGYRKPEKPLKSGQDSDLKPMTGAPTGPNNRVKPVVKATAKMPSNAGKNIKLSNELAELYEREELMDLTKFFRLDEIGENLDSDDFSVDVV